MAQEKKSIYEKIKNELSEKGFKIESFDFDRPWGGFFVIEEHQILKFVEQYFPEIAIEELKITQKLSPKILVVAPNKRLSWQYHDRRAEIWRVISGPVAVATSNTNIEAEIHTYQVGNLIKLEQGERHRLIGLEGWGIVAEIWQHTNSQNPSDEDDIYRLQDDFGR